MALEDAMNATETVNELRRLELEIMEHEKALEDLRRQSREVLEVLTRRPDRRSILSREGRQRFLAGCGSASKRSQPA
jgi:hypothetical protein